MRKDFLVDPYQVLEARAAGAGGVLLILRMLSTGADVRNCSMPRPRIGMFVLLEAFDLERFGNGAGVYWPRARAVAESQRMTS